MSYSQRYKLDVEILDPITLKYKFKIHPESIVRMDIVESVISILPKIDISFFGDSDMLDKYIILDKDMIKISLNNVFDTKDTKINATFIISSINTTTVMQNNGVNINISGYLSTNSMFSPFIKTSYSGSSSDVLRGISKQIGMKFNNNADGSDNIRWYQASDNFKFINYIKDRSYIPNDGVFVYGDLQNRLNYMSFRNIMIHEPRYTAKYSPTELYSETITDVDKTTMYYDGYNILNTTEIYNNISGYGGQWSWYNCDEYNEEEINIDIHNTKYKNINNEYIRETFSDYSGVIYDLSIMETIKAIHQNNHVKMKLFSNTISLNVRNIVNINLFDSIKLDISSFTADTILKPYSGIYFITSIVHSIVKDSSPGYNKKILISRNGINSSKGVGIL